jgi:hypothetical protein
MSGAAANTVLSPRHFAPRRYFFLSQDGHSRESGNLLINPQEFSFKDDKILFYLKAFQNNIFVKN